MASCQNGYKYVGDNQQPSGWPGGRSKLSAGATMSNIIDGLQSSKIVQRMMGGA